MKGSLPQRLLVPKSESAIEVPPVIPGYQHSTTAMSSSLRSSMVTMPPLNSSSTTGTPGTASMMALVRLYCIPGIRMSMRSCPSPSMSPEMPIASTTASAPLAAATAALKLAVLNLVHFMSEQPCTTARLAVPVTLPMASATEVMHCGPAQVPTPMSSK